MQVFGHRGAAGYSPENTLRSIRQALSMRVDGIEVDVRVTQDEVPVVIHDATLDRTTCASGAVSSYSSAELRALFRHSADFVPTVLEVLTEVTTATRVNLELKESRACDPTFWLLEKCAGEGIIERSQMLITSFDLEAITRFRKLTDNYAVGLLTMGTPADAFWRLARQLNAACANIDLAAVNPGFVQRAHQQGLDVMVYTVNCSDDAGRMLRMGVDAIFSDYPDRVRN